MTTYTYNNKELTEINDYYERSAYYLQAKEEYNKAKEITFLPVGENASPYLLHVLNDNREDAQFNTFFIRNTILETFKSGNMRAASNIISSLGQENESGSSFDRSPHREMIESVVSEQLRKNSDWLSQLEPHAKFTIADIFAEKDTYKLKKYKFRKFQRKRFR